MAQVGSRKARRRASNGQGMLIIACGALAHEITALRRANGWDQLDVRCLPAELHNRPERIPAAVRALIQSSRCHYRSIFVAYGDCGTGGLLDAVLRGGGRRAHPGRPLLRVLRDRPCVRGACRGGARHVLSHGFSAAAFRAPGDSRSRARSPPGAVLELLRQLSQARLPGAGAEDANRWNRRAPSRRAWVWNSNIAEPATGRLATLLESAVSASDARREDARATRRLWHGIADHHFLARHPRAGHRQARPRNRQGAALAALSRSGGPRRHARRQGQLGCLSRRLAAQRAASLRR